jgi:hypothetical protein
MNERMLLLVLCVSLSACASCARKSAPLPGDSVQADGAVSLATPPLSTVIVGGGASAREPLSALESRLFPTELVMEKKALLALRPDQEAAITKELDVSQAELIKLQWALQTEKDALVSVLDHASVDETRARVAADALMVRENAIKSAHLRQLIRIKNILTAEQQELLRNERERERCRGH